MYSIDDKTLIERLGQLDPITFELIRSMVLQSDKIYMQFLKEHRKRFADQLTDSQIGSIFVKESKYLKQYNKMFDNITEILSSNKILTGTEEENRMEMRSHVYNSLLMHMSRLGQV